jgi:hypothetical protein
VALVGCEAPSTPSKPLTAEQVAVQKATKEAKQIEYFGLPGNARNVKVISEKGADTWLTFELPPLEGDGIRRDRKFLFFHHGWSQSSDSRSNTIVELR